MMSRREFLRHCTRLLLFSLLTAGLYRIAGRKRSSGLLLDDCVSDSGVCRGCPLLSKCGHPQARSYKEAVHETP